MTDTGPSRRRALTLALVVVECAVLLALADGVARLLLPSGLRFIHPQMLVEPHARRIYDYRPGQKAFTIDKPFITNSRGFRDEREIPAEKGEEIRVLSLGDSIALGLGVAAEDAYARQLEGRLARRYGSVRVINAGVGCYSTWQEVDLLSEKGLDSRPDVVLLGFFWNDLYVKPHPVEPLPAERAGEQADANLQYLRLLKRSPLLLFLRERLVILRNRMKPTFDWTHQETILQGRSNAYLERAYGDVATSLREFGNLGRQNGFVPIVIIFPHPAQVSRPDSPTVMQERIHGLAVEAGVRTIDMLNPLRRSYATGEELYIPWDHTHLTPHGHSVVAAELEGVIVRDRLIDGRPPS